MEKYEESMYYENDFQYEENEENEQEKLMRYQINSYSVDRAIETLIKWKKNGKLIVPEFQREYVWSYSNSCRFIDSILLNLPIPNIFVFKLVEEGDERYLLVDGMQRITTIEQFRNGTWHQGSKNRNFKINIKSSNWYNKAFADLDETDHQFFLDYPLSVMIFEASANSNTESKNVIFSVFERINTGSEKLTEQEIRNTIYQGQCLDDLKQECVSGGAYMSLLAQDTTIQKRGREIEFLLRILAYQTIYQKTVCNSKLLVDGDENSRITTSKTVMLNNYLYYANSGLIDYKNALNNIIEAASIILQITDSAFYSVKRDKSGIGNKVHQIFAEALVMAVIENDFTINLSEEQFNESKIALWKDEELFYSTFIEKTTDPLKVVNRIEKMVKFINGEKIWKD